jgi:hypothetical protein
MSSPLEDYVEIGITRQNVMLNQVLNLIQDLRFQHLMESICY